VANSSVPVWQAIIVSAPNETTVSGNAFVPKTQEMFSYDLDGNLAADGRWNYTWDGENRLIALVANTAVGPQQSIRFEYDSKGRRVGKKVWNNLTFNGTPSLEQKFLYDGWNLIAVLNSSFALQTSFYWGSDLSGAMQGAGGVGGLLEINDAANGVHLVGYDGNGNVGLLTKGSDGSISARYEYGPFGELLRTTGPMGKTNPFRFSTKYQDDETDLLYYGYRYYNASTGKWLSRDPLTDEEGLDAAEEVGGMNLYGFCCANPINLFDDLGLAFYAIGGTLETAASRANPWQLYNETTERPRHYWRGPHGPMGTTRGSDAWDITLRVYDQIEQDFCAAKASGQNLTINLTGWSRGAMIASMVAKMLNDSGLWCNECFTLKHYQPVKVNWVGLFDAVSMMKDMGFPTAVPSNVAHFDHAIKTKHTGKQRIFPTWHFSGSNERAFNNNDGSLTTHADIGMSVILGNHNDVYPWIKGQATAAGVGF
jgi:RHS repeat-associated protein